MKLAHVLVVEGSETVMRAFRLGMNRLGIQVSFDPAGESVVRLLSNDAIRTGCIFLCQPPSGSSRALEAIQGLRAAEKDCIPKVVQVLSTGNLVDSDFLKSQGVDAVLYKPFGKDELVKLLTDELKFEIKQSTSNSPASGFIPKPAGAEILEVNTQEGHKVESQEFLESPKNQLGRASASALCVEAKGQIDSEQAALLRKVAEEYCKKHFKDIAEEVIKKQLSVIVEGEGGEGRATLNQD